MPLSKRSMLILATCLTGKLCVCLSLQLSKRLLVSLSQLAEPAAGWNPYAIRLEKQDLLTALPFPFVNWQVLDDKLLGGWERKECSTDDLLL